MANRKPAPQWLVRMREARRADADVSRAGAPWAVDEEIQIGHVAHDWPDEMLAAYLQRPLVEVRAKLVERGCAWKAATFICADGSREALDATSDFPARMVRGELVCVDASGRTDRPARRQFREHCEGTGWTPRGVGIATWSGYPADGVGLEEARKALGVGKARLQYVLDVLGAERGPTTKRTTKRERLSVAATTAGKSKTRHAWFPPLELWLIVDVCDGAPVVCPPRACQYVFRRGARKDELCGRETGGTAGMFGGLVRCERHRGHLTKQDRPRR